MIFILALGIGAGAWWARAGTMTPQPVEDGFHLIVNKMQNRLYVYDNERLQASYPVATGREPDLTPEGAFLVVTKWEIEPTDDQGHETNSPFGTRWIGLSVPDEPDALDGSRYGIHGTNEPNSIGTHASAGCIRMHNPDVEDLFASIPIGATVYIRSGSRLWKTLAGLQAALSLPNPNAAPLIAGCPGKEVRP